MSTEPPMVELKRLAMDLPQGPQKAAAWWAAEEIEQLRADNAKLKQAIWDACREIANR